MKPQLTSSILIKLACIEPDDKYTPKVHCREELDALKIPVDRRDTCKDYYAEFKKCIHVQH